MGHYIYGKVVSPTQGDITLPEDSIFDFQCYSFYAWIGLRERAYCQIPVLPGVSRGHFDKDLESFIYRLPVSTLLDFDYSQKFENRRVTRQERGIWNGSATAEPGEGEIVTYEENFGPWIMAAIRKLEPYRDGYLEYYFR